MSRYFLLSDLFINCTTAKFSLQHFDLPLSCCSKYQSLTLSKVVVAQLVERSLPLPEVRGSIPVIGKNLFIY